MQHISSFAVGGLPLILACPQEWADRAGMLYINAKRPLAFALWGPRTLRTLKGHKLCLHQLLEGLRGIKDGNTATYEVQCKVLDANWHGGLPQSRRHVFVVGISRKCVGQAFTWPRRARPVPLKDLLDAQVSCFLPYPRAVIARGMRRIAARQGHPATETWLIGRKAKRILVAKDKCPYLNKASARAGGCFVTNHGRMLTTAEMMRLQGIAPRHLKAPAGVTEQQFAGMIGDTMPVPLLARVTLQMCKATGIVTQRARTRKAFV